MVYFFDPLRVLFVCYIFALPLHEVVLQLSRCSGQVKGCSCSLYH